MRLFLIRHGETVDNVAGLYAGSRDSALTAHGVLQARRLASHLAEKVTVKHLFSSNLRRAVDTAEAVLDAQKRAGRDELSLVQLPELREKDFGSGEGAKFGAKTAYDDAESAEVMKLRVDRFLDEHLLPLLDGTDDSHVCVIIAHGIILGVLFKTLFARFSPSNVSTAPEAQKRGSTDPGSGLILPGWGNTGYLEAILSKPVTNPPQPKGKGQSSLSGWKLHVKSINCTDHVKGLKKTRGGIGSAKFDSKQKTMDTFLQPASRKRKLDEDERGEETH